MALNQEDALAIQGLAGRLGVPVGSLAGLMELESGIDPNIWGGAGGQYRGLIQFGPGARKEVGLPSGAMSVAQQIPFVEKYFRQRGFQPGKHGVTEMYRTVLVGNPGQSGTDSFGTNSDSAAKRMLPGGDLYDRAVKKLGGFASGGGGGFQGATAAAALTPSLENFTDLGVPGGGGGQAGINPVAALAKAMFPAQGQPGAPTGTSQRFAGQRMSAALGAIARNAAGGSAGAQPSASLAMPEFQTQPAGGGQMSQPGARSSFEKPESVVYETASGQPGVDVWFASKKFPAAFDGVVKDVAREKGYGNYVVIESIDPTTGKPVDILKSHLADGGVYVRPGQQVKAGDIIGMQGGTGNVRSSDGTIASIDFLAPKEPGSRSMEPYSNFDALRRLFVRRLQGVP